MKPRSLQLTLQYCPLVDDSSFLFESLNTITNNNTIYVVERKKINVSGIVVNCIHYFTCYNRHNIFLDFWSFEWITVSSCWFFEKLSSHRETLIQSHMLNIQLTLINETLNTTCLHRSQRWHKNKVLLPSTGQKEKSFNTHTHITS